MTRSIDEIHAEMQALKAEQLTAAMGPQWSGIRDRKSDVTTLEAAGPDGRRLVRLGSEAEPYRVDGYWLVDDEGVFRPGSETNHNCFTACGERGVCIIPVPKAN